MFMVDKVTKANPNFGDLISVKCHSLGFLSRFIDNLTWQICSTAGESPGEFSKVFVFDRLNYLGERRSAESCIVGENLYIFGGRMENINDDKQHDIFELDLSNFLNRKAISEGLF